jgi:hypothetical protein
MCIVLKRLLRSLELQYGIPDTADMKNRYRCKAISMISVVGRRIGFADALDISKPAEIIRIIALPQLAFLFQKGSK